MAARHPSGQTESMKAHRYLWADRKQTERKGEKNEKKKMMLKKKKKEEERKCIRSAVTWREYWIRVIHLRLKFHCNIFQSGTVHAMGLLLLLLRSPPSLLYRLGAAVGMRFRTPVSERFQDYGCLDGKAKGWESNGRCRL